MRICKERGPTKNLIKGFEPLRFLIPLGKVNVELLDRYTVSRWTEVQINGGIEELNTETDYWIGGQMIRRTSKN